MLAKRITRVTLTRTFEPSLNGENYEGIEWWRVEWTVSYSTAKSDHLMHTHYTEKAARRHVANLLKL